MYEQMLCVQETSRVGGKKAKKKVELYESFMLGWARQPGRKPNESDTGELIRGHCFVKLPRLATLLQIRAHELRW